MLQVLIEFLTYIHKKRRALEIHNYGSLQSIPVITFQLEFLGADETLWSHALS